MSTTPVHAIRQGFSTQELTGLLTNHVPRLADVPRLPQVSSTAVSMKPWMNGKGIHKTCSSLAGYQRIHHAQANLSNQLCLKGVDIPVAIQSDGTAYCLSRPRTQHSMRLASLSCLTRTQSL